MLYVSGAFWVSFICVLLAIVIFGGMSGIAKVTGELYWEDIFFKLGTNLGTFFTATGLLFLILWIILKLTMQK